MSIVDYQRQFEIEAAQVAKARKEAFKAKFDMFSVEFDAEILKLASLIDGWRETDRRNNDRGAKRVYDDMLRTIPSAQLADVLVRGIVEAIYVLDTATHAEGVAFQKVVDHGFIQRRLPPLISITEREIEKKWKISVVDLLVQRTVDGLPTIFKQLKADRKRKSDVIVLTESAKERIGTIDIHDILVDVPMKCPPAPWTSVFDGGFLTLDMQKGNPLIRSEYHSYADMKKIDQSLQEKPEILQSINKLQNVAYRIDPNYDYYLKVIDQVRAKKLKELSKKHAEERAEIRALEQKIASETVDSD
jgi:hypothetical protein